MGLRVTPVVHKTFTNSEENTFDENSCLLHFPCMNATDCGLHMIQNYKEIKADYFIMFVSRMHVIRRPTPRAGSDALIVSTKPNHQRGY